MTKTRKAAPRKRARKQGVLVLVKRASMRVLEVNPKAPGRYQRVNLPGEGGLKSGDSVLVFRMASAGTAELREGDVVLRRVDGEAPAVV
jgi:hypothetical protein